MLKRLRFNPWRLLLLAGTIIVVQRARPFASARIPALAGLLGVAPNLVAAMGLPFTWATRGELTRGEHWRRCVVTVLALGLYECAQGAGIGAGHLRFDPNDILASIAGAGLAATAGWRMVRSPALREVSASPRQGQ
jgi:hypothetical protein